MEIWQTVLLFDLSGFSNAVAYIGPGGGITLLGALFAVLLAILLVVGGILVWPVRVLLRRMKRKARPPEDAEEGAPESEDGTEC